MTRLRSAITQGQRPTAAILSLPNPMGEWTERDYIIQDAYFTMDREICGMCKNPVWLCHSTDNRIDFEAKVRTCYGRTTIEEFEESPKGKKLDKGEYIIAVPVGLDDGRGNREPLPNRQEAYSRMPSNED